MGLGLFVRSLALAGWFQYVVNAFLGFVLLVGFGGVDRIEEVLVCAPCVAEVSS